MIYDMNGGWVTGPALPQGMGGCRAVSTDGEIFISGTTWIEHGNGDDDAEYHAFVYRNAEWIEVTGPGPATVTGDRPVVDCSEIETLRLG